MCTVYIQHTYTPPPLQTYTIGINNNCFNDKVYVFLTNHCLIEAFIQEQITDIMYKKLYMMMTPVLYGESCIIKTMEMLEC